MAKPRLRGGIDLGGTKVQAIVMDEANSVLGSSREPTPTQGKPKDVADTMAGAMRAATEAAGAELSDLAGVGVGAPGAVDISAGTVTGASNLPGWSGCYPLAGVLADLLGTDVVLGNDVTLATEAEFHLGAGRPYRSMLGVFCGTGVGGGLILDGKPWIGRGAAGEFGHMVIRRNGAKCLCGRRGCVEAYAGRGAMELSARRAVRHGHKTDLFQIMESRGRTRLTSGVFARALERADPLATLLIKRAIRALGAGIGSAVNLLDIEAVIIGGGLGLRLGEPFVESVRAATQPHLFVSDRPPAMLLAELGDLGGAVGGALLVTQS